VTPFQRGVYVVTLILCAAATALLIAPAAFHRVVYRRRLKQHLVRVANRLALAGLGFLVLAMASALLLILDVVTGPVWAAILVAVVLMWFMTWWFIVPFRSRLRHPPGGGDG
jgi:O-antigen/teichoic acid export membrane protein